MAKPSPPTREHLDQGVEYCFNSDGTILRRPGELCWSFDVTGGLFDAPCTFRAPTGTPTLSIRKTGFWSAEFEMTEQGARVGTIRRRNFLRTRYSVELSGGVVWDVRVPLYSMHFHALSSDGAQIFLVLERGPRWYALTEPRSNEPRILMALAFVYRGW